MSAAGPSYSLGTGDVHVWWIDLAQVSEVAAILSPDERARAARLRQPGDRPRWIKARIAMRQILAGYVGVPSDVLRLATADHGKPELVDEPSLRFSLTHAVDRAALAVAWQREVGIDLESSDPTWPSCRDLPALIATACTTAEAAWIAALPEGERLEVFLKIWTLKEAYLKGIGAGLAREPRTLEITFGEGDRASIQEASLLREDHDKWDLLDFPEWSLTPSPSPSALGEGSADRETRLWRESRPASRLPSPGSTGEGLRVRVSHWTLHILNPGPGWVAALAVSGADFDITVYRWPPDSGQPVG